MHYISHRIYPTKHAITINTHEHYSQGVIPTDAELLQSVCEQYALDNLHFMNHIVCCFLFTVRFQRIRFFKSNIVHPNYSQPVQYN